MKKNNLTYMESVHRSGRIWGIVVAIVLLSFPLLLSAIFSTMPNLQVLAKGIIATAPMYWAVGIIEILTYVPMLGAGGTYLSFVTGNISNLKLPCAIDAMERAYEMQRFLKSEMIVFIVMYYWYLLHIYTAKDVICYKKIIIILLL